MDIYQNLESTCEAHIPISAIRQNYRAVAEALVMAEIQLSIDPRSLEYRKQHRRKIIEHCFARLAYVERMTDIFAPEPTVIFR